MNRGRTQSTAFLSKTSVSFGSRLIQLAADRKNRLMAAELAGAFAVWRGIADWSWPASLIVAGLAVIAVVEVRS